ncbi:MAG TPA: LysR family transcriptional regulator [Bacillota bacterium]|nr:LysR family transcriptional regulator [Bacillota bacterium]
MELNQLKTFITIAKAGSFTKAAEVLDYAQSSVSGQIKALEDEFETRLFERLGREVTLTEDGRRLLDHAEQLLKLAEETRESVSSRSVPKGTLVIGAPESICIFRLPPLLQEYRKRYPNVKLVLKQGSCGDTYSWLQKNLIDLAFLLDTPIDISAFVIRPLTKEPTTVIASVNHPLLAKGTVESRDFAGEDLILIEEDGCYRRAFENQLAESGVQPGSVQEFGSVELIKKCVASGLGISILPQIAVKKEIADGELADLHWRAQDFNIYTQMLYRKDKWLSPALSAMIELAKEQNGKLS